MSPQSQELRSPRRLAPLEASEQAEGQLPAPALVAGTEEAAVTSEDSWV